MLILSPSRTGFGVGGENHEEERECWEAEGAERVVTAYIN